MRYVRQPRNIGLAPNHNVVVEQARGELFKWAACDDLYARELIERCVDALDEHPDVVLAHSWSGADRRLGHRDPGVKYPLNTSSARAPERFRSLLFGSGGDDDYGVIRTEVLRRTAMKESYHHADRTIIAELALHGRFFQVPDWLYFRRDHPQRAERCESDDAEPVRQHGPAPGRTGCAIRRSGCTTSTSGRSSGRSAARRCRRRTGGGAMGTSSVVREPSQAGPRRTGRGAAPGARGWLDRIDRGRAERDGHLKPGRIPGSGQVLMATSDFGIPTIRSNQISLVGK